MKLENISTCPVCNGQEFDHIQTCKDVTVTKEHFEIVRCKGCSLLITSPRPDQNNIAKYYNSNSYISHSEKSQGLFSAIYFLARKLALRNKKSLIEKFSEKGSILDIGCGTGTFIQYMKKFSWKVTGTEPSEKARRIALLTKLDIKESLDQINGTDFNVITLWHVVEHIHDLNTTIKKIATILKTNGTIFIAVPNHKSKDAEYYGEHWAAYDVPRHLWHFNQRNMQKLLESNNLRIVEIVPLKMDAYYISLISEEYKNPKLYKIIRIINALFKGFKSNAKASATKEYSSLIYVAKKK